MVYDGDSLQLTKISRNEMGAYLCIGNYFLKIRTRAKKWAFQDLTLLVCYSDTFISATLSVLVYIQEVNLNQKEIFSYFASVWIPIDI